MGGITITYRGRAIPRPPANLASDLRRRIVLNELRPGSVLTELGLAAELACSQAAVREALLRLEGEGLVRRAGRQGTSVTDLDAETAAEMLDLRRRIELRGARRAARRAGAGEVAELRRRLDAMARAAAASALWPLIEHDMEFHLALFRLSGFHALEPILARVMLHTQRFKLWAPWHQRPLAETAARHAPILAALQDRDSASLVRTLGAHLDTVVEHRRAA